MVSTVCVKAGSVIPGGEETAVVKVRVFPAYFLKFM